MKTGKIFRKLNNKYTGLVLILTAGLVFYMLHATAAGLWYDEAIEYYFSKFAVGEVPGSFGTTTMMERILSTYQPPLYNVLMNIWLKVYDSEFFFRLAGILVTVAGAAGFFLAVDEYTEDGKWAVLGTAFYTFTPGVIYYGLECGEYNLMLCFLSWAVYFFLRTLKRKDAKSLLGFFVFCVLSVYSHYGAAFSVAGMYFMIVIDIFRAKEKQLIKKLILFTAVTLFGAVLPLAVLFLIPQISGQGSLSISNAPYFAQGNVIVDLIKGAYKTLLYIYGEWLYVAFLLILICLAALILDFRTMMKPAAALLISFFLYYIAVACSFYGYNKYYEHSVGTMNIAGRYSYFLIPMITAVLFTGVHVLSQKIRPKNPGMLRAAAAAGIICAGLFCAGETYKMRIWEMGKDDVREAVLVWYDAGAMTGKTLLDPMDDVIFHFYLTHDKRYDPQYDDQIETVKMGTDETDYNKIRSRLEDMGYLDCNDYYYVSPHSPRQDVFVQVMADEGYKMSRLYDKNTVFLHVVR